ncbi:MAG TPA: HEAT repeat domain-containing protein, partial [Polyangiaceae bacterium]
PRARPSIEWLLDASSTTSDERLLLVSALGEFDAREAESRLAHIVTQSESSLANASAGILYLRGSGVPLPGLLERLARGSANRDALLLTISGMLARTVDLGALDAAGRLFSTLYTSERDAILEGLARNPHPHAWQLVLQFMSRANEHDLGKVAESIHESPERSAVLLQLAHHPSLRVRLNAVWSLGRTSSDLAYQPLLEASADPNPQVRANALVGLGRIRRASRRSVTPIVCPRLRDKEPLIRQAALMGLLASGERCVDGRERVLLLGDAHEQIRHTAALIVADTQRRSPNARDAWALRYCRAFEVNDDVRQRCAFGSLGASRGRLQGVRLPPGALMFASADRFPSHDFAGRVVGLERPDGLVRIAMLDRRGGIFEPDIEPSEARLVPAGLHH